MKETKPAEIDIYELDKRIEGAKRRLQGDETVSERNKELILEFDDYRRRTGVSKPNRDKWLNYIRVLASLLKVD